MTDPISQQRAEGILHRLEADPTFAKRLMRGPTYRKRLKAVLADDAARRWLRKRLQSTPAAPSGEPDFETLAGGRVKGALEEVARRLAYHKDRRINPYDEDPL